MSTQDESLGRVVRRLEERIDDLEEQLAEKDERIEELESKVEFRGGGQAIENIWVCDRPLGKAVENRKEKVKDLERRVENIERGKVDPSEVVANAASFDPEKLLTIHRKYLEVKNTEPSEHGLSANKETAARLFPYITKYAYTNEGTMKLPSTKVREILVREVYDGDDELGQRLKIVDPNPNKIKRVMRFVGEFGGDVMEFDTSEKTNHIVIDRDAWMDYQETVADLTTSSDTETDLTPDYDGVSTTEEVSYSEESEEEMREKADEELEKLSSGGDYTVVNTDEGVTVNSTSGR